MGVLDHVPGLKAGKTRRNVGVALVYLLLLPLVVVLTPFFLLYAVGTNRNGLSETLSNSPLAVVPPIRRGGWQSALTVFVAAVVLLGALGALAPAETNGTDSGLDGTDEPTQTPDEAGVAGGDSGDDDTDETVVDGTDDRNSEDTDNDDRDTGGTDNQETSDTSETDSDADDTAETIEETPETPLEIHHIDVGQADSTLLITPENETVLVDTGDWRPAGEEVISYLDDRGIERIDHLVATHPHADHIGGHAAVIEHYEENHDGIGALYDAGVPHDTQTYENYLDAVEEYGHELLVVEEGDELPLESESVDALVLNPPVDESGGDLHYNSIAIVFELDEFRYLMTGDAETAAEERLVEEWADKLSADLYHAGHHGSSTSSTEPFMDAVTPERAVISSAYDSQYGHPHDEVLDRFDSMDIETYWTGVHGDIVITTDGETTDVETTDEFSTDPQDILEETRDGDDAHSLSPPAVFGKSGLVEVVTVP